MTDNEEPIAPGTNGTGVSPKEQFIAFHDNSAKTDEEKKKHGSVLGLTTTEISEALQSISTPPIASDHTHSKILPQSSHAGDKKRTLMEEN